jgi:hypothetical protein
MKPPFATIAIFSILGLPSWFFIILPATLNSQNSKQKNFLKHSTGRQGFKSYLTGLKNPV